MAEDRGPHYMDESQSERDREPEIAEPKNILRDEFAMEALARYSGTDVEAFQPLILLTNFPSYVKAFAEQYRTPMISGPVLNVAHSEQLGISIIDYQLGAPMAGLVVDLLAYTKPQCVVMLGLCGGLHRAQAIGDFLLPMAAIRDEGTSKHYMPPQVPSLPAFLVQLFISEELMAQKIPFKTGVIHTTDYRMWEYDPEFIKILETEKASAIDMECSTLFTVAFKRKVPIGALMLISDLPLKPGGKKTKASSERIFMEYRDLHLQCGIDALLRMKHVMRMQKINFRRFQFSYGKDES